MKIVTRFAPSPTGYVHIGSLRTVLYNYLFTKKNNGKFMLRVEDTDQSRYVEGSIENMLKVLERVGLSPDEGPNKLGDFGPYYQSERLEIYNKYVKELIENGKAYYCFCSSERLEKIRNEQNSLGLASKYDKKCRFLSKEEVEEKLKAKLAYTIRLKVPENEDIIFEDIIKGNIKVNTKDIDDQILLKSDNFPTYHLANVIDDHLMQISHVIRGDEWLPSTPKHIILYKAFGWQAPLFAHIPLLLGKDKKKLSKRTGDVAVENYLEKGYLVESIINYISLLGWNPKTNEEFFLMDELIQKFELKNVHKAGAIFDIERLKFFNSYYLKNLDIEYIYEKFIEFLENYNTKLLEKIKSFNHNFNKKVLNEIKTKIKNFDEFEENTKFIYNKIEYNIDKNLLLNEKMKIDNIEIVKIGLNLSLKILKENKDFENIEEIKNIFIEKINESGLKNGQVLWPLRISLTGEEFSIGALEMIFILGNKLSIEKIEKTLINI